MSHRAGMAFLARYAFAPFGGQSGRVRPEGRTIPDRDQRVADPRLSRGLSGVLPRFARPIYAAVRRSDPVSENRSSSTSATSAQAPNAGETAAAPAASVDWRILSANKPGASR